MEASRVELFATAVFGLAVLHTFAAQRIGRWSHRFPAGSAARLGLHLLSETELVFGFWALILLAGRVLLEGALEPVGQYLRGQDYTEALFVTVIMVVAATRPVIGLAEQLITGVARWLPLPAGVAFYLAALFLGPLLGSFITEPAAMTLLALLLKRRYFDHGISPRLAYATLGLLFVNVSIGGTLTQFAAPPVLMVASTWNWDLAYMATHFGWRAAVSAAISTALVASWFRRELAALPEEPATVTRPALWLTGLHVALLAAVVVFAHHVTWFAGVFAGFLVLYAATRAQQDALQWRTGLLVGIFLAGLVTLGGLQTWWLAPLLRDLNGSALFFGTTALTAVTDNAALTYLGSLVPGLADGLKYALMAGAVVGGGLTVIANAPNPAGVGILKSARAFAPDGISPLGLLLGALPPTAVAVVWFWLLK